MGNYTTADDLTDINNNASSLLCTTDCKNKSAEFDIAMYLAMKREQ